VESIIKEPIEGMAEIVNEVSGGHLTALVSNTNEIHYNLSQNRFKALRVLQKHYLSYELHVMKPDKKFYQAIVNDLGASASSMLFVDDLEENIKAAKDCGMQGVRFHNPEQFYKELLTLGVLG